MNEGWTRFRALPGWAQAAVWVVAWPLVVPLLIVNRSRERWATVVAVAFALVMTPAWVSAFVGGDGATDEPTTPSAADIDQPTPTRSASEPSGEPSDPPSGTDPTGAPDTEAEATPSATETQTSAGSSPAPEGTGPSEADGAPALTVVNVTDGDTLVARDGSGEFRIRLAQVDAPETPNECFSAEATDALRAMAGAGTTIQLRRPAPPYTDPYGRRLGEVVTSDGVSVSVELVRQGYAGWGADFADEDPDLAARMRAAEQEARASGQGLWSACGGRHVTGPPPPRAAGGEPDTDEPPADEPPAPDAGDQANPWGTGSCHPAYEPCVPPKSETGDLNCPDIRQHHPDGVRVDHTHGDPHGLDRDEDGWGCE